MHQLSIAPAIFRIAPTVALVLIARAAPAADIGWANTAADFNADANWTGAAAPTDDLATDIGVFSGTPAAQPTLTADRSVAGLRFSSDGWTLGGGQTLTLGQGDPNNLDPNDGQQRTLDLNANNATLTLDVNLALGADQNWATNGGGLIVVNGVISGGGQLRFGDGDGSFPGNSTYRLNGDNTYAGNTVIEHGKVQIGSNTALGVGTLDNQKPFGAKAPTLEAFGGDRTLANVLRDGFVVEGDHDLTFTGGAVMSSTTQASWTHNGAGTLTLGGAITGSVKEFKLRGTGVIQLTGNVSNTGMNQNNNDGLVLDGQNVVEFNKAAGFDVSGGHTTIHTGATARWLASDQLGDTRRLNLRGGTADFNGFDETTGDLILSADSTLDLGGSSQAAFSDSSDRDWGANTLTIEGFVIGVSTLRFGADANGLTADQLGLIRFAGFGDAAGQIDADGFVTPIPEPASLVLLAAGVGLLVGRGRVHRHR